MIMEPESPTTETPIITVINAIHLRYAVEINAKEALMDILVEPETAAKKGH